MIGYGNHISKWIAREVSRCQDVTEKQTVTRFFLEILEEMLNLDNFNGASTILTGLTSPSLSLSPSPSPTASSLAYSSNAVATPHLEGIDAECRKKIQKYEAYFSPKLHMKGYRDAIAKVSPNSPCIPYIHAVLNDLIGITDSLPDVIDGGLIHFKKCRAIASFAEYFLSYRRSYSLLEPIFSIQKWIYEVIRDQVSFPFSLSLHLTNTSLSFNWLFSLSLSLLPLLSVVVGNVWGE